MALKTPEAIHIVLIENLQDQMTEDDFKKFKSFCSEKIPPAVLEKKYECRDVLAELKDRGVITVAVNGYQWLNQTFVHMNRQPLCLYIEKAQEEFKKLSKGITRLIILYSFTCLPNKGTRYFVLI